MRMMNALLIVFATTFVPPSVGADEPAILTISGAIETTNRAARGDGVFAALDIEYEAAFALSRSDLLAHEQHAYSDPLPNREIVAHYEGPHFLDVLEAAGVSGNAYVLTALDGYSVTVAHSQIVERAPILAVTARGASMDIGHYGPIKLVFPPDADPEVDETLRMLEVWALVHIKVE